MSRRQLPEWKALEEHGRRLRRASIGELIAADPARPAAWQLQAPAVRIDYSRQLADADTLALLERLARACRLEEARDAMFRGEPVNTTEDRPAWHTALRSPPADRALAARLSGERERMFELAQTIRALHAKGTCRDVIVLGIGGSDLGPRLVTAALGPGSGPNVRFVSNIDPVDLDDALVGARPDATHVIAVSKSFTTLETLENLAAARTWLGPHAGRRIHAVTAAPDRAVSTGIDPANVLTMQDWVGGRFSVWSACGIPIAIAHGVEAFEALLAGAAEMDRHHASAPLMRNGPVLLALLDAWNGNFLDCSSRAVFPYSQRLRALVSYLQQLEMESGGKRTDLDGRPVDYPTARVVWGEAGTVAQHSVFQFLHQGTEPVPCEFIAVATHRAGSRRERLLAEFAVAQADALAFGDSALPEALRPDREWARCEGSRPSVLLWLDDLSPRALGNLLALNEHRTAARAVLWNINAFDQWGVEIGKRLLKARGAH